MTERFRPLRREELDPRQQAVFDSIQAGPRGAVPWIFHLYLESPELAARLQELGAFCRYGTDLARHLSELAILVVARHWGAEYEWRIHEGEARKAGVSEEAIAAISRGEEPHFDDADALLVYEFLTEYLGKNDVSDALYERAVDRLGRKSVVELAGILGYYSMLAMAIRIFRIPPER